MIYEYWFAGIPHLSDKKKKMLREYLGSGEAVYYIEEIALRRMPFLGEKEIQAVLKADKCLIRENYERLKDAGIRFVPYFSPDYPERLTNIQSPPYALYIKGRLPDEGKHAIAIVGARKCTAYGEQMALRYAGVLAGAGVQIISGMARGIDGAGQRGALNAGGTTYGVLGCGVDICYPREHLGLYMDIQKQGGLISEQLPGCPPLPVHFPARNRIISGLSDVILVMEAREKSGSLITADMALEQGKDVYALPGPAESLFSRGCHRLIAQGAGILISPEELMETLSVQIQKSGENSDKDKKILESGENIVYSCLGLIPKGLQELVQETGLCPKELMEQLITLELRGDIQEVFRNYYIRTR